MNLRDSISFSDKNLFFGDWTQRIAYADIKFKGRDCENWQEKSKKVADKNLGRKSTSASCLHRSMRNEWRGSNIETVFGFRSFQNVAGARAEQTNRSPRYPDRTGSAPDAQNWFHGYPAWPKKNVRNVEW